jgi:hypothetical protein
MINAILGAGEVAQAVRESLIEENAHMFDAGQWEDLDLNYRFLHICIPYTPKFIQIVEDAKKVFKPKYICIHSTVKPGTSKILNTVYSPVVGRHANGLGNQLKVYNKLFAGEDSMMVLAQFSIKCQLWTGSTDSLEYAKIMSTTRMYWDLYFQKIMQKDCKDNGYSFEDVYTRWTRNYNKGTTVKHPEWGRPVYDEMVEDLPGGHCLQPNIRLFENDVTAILRSYETEVQNGN